MFQFRALLQGRWFSKDGLNALIVALFASLGGMIALSDYTSERAANIQTLYVGQMLEQTMRASSTLAVGQFDADYAWSQAFRLWIEMDSLAYLAAVNGTDALADQYDAVRDQVTQLSPLLRAPYFDPQADSRPNIERYESDIYLVELTRQQQTLELTGALSDYWLSVAFDGYALNRIFTTGLLLLGFITSLFQSRRLKQVGLALVVMIALYGAARFLVMQGRVPPSLDAQAMQYLAEGVGLAHQQRFEEAIAAYDAALALESQYAEARVQRGFAYRDLHDQTGQAELLTAAAQDMEAALAAGRREADVVGQLAEIYYLQGQFAEALRVSAVGQETGAFIHSFDLARTLLASGQIEQAQAAYEQALSLASAQYARATPTQPLALSFWRDLDVAALELDDLARCAEADRAEACQGNAPPLLGRSDLAQAARQQAAAIKSLSVSLEQYGAQPPTPHQARAAALDFQADPDFVSEGGFVIGAGEIQVSFDYEDAPTNADLLVKAFVNDWEYAPLRHRGRLQEADGRYTFSLSPGIDLGEYRLEVFINGRWVQQGHFQMLAEANP